MLAKLSESDQSQLIAAMKSIENILNAKPPAPYVLRSHRPGDIGWITHRHGVLYAQEYGWDEKFEAMVAGIAQKFVENFDPDREHCWMAEQDGNIIGSVMLVKKTETVAKLRLLVRGTHRSRPGLGRPTGPGMHRLCPRSRLSQNHSLDQLDFAGREENL